MSETEQYVRLIRESSVPLEPLPLQLAPEWQALVPGQPDGRPDQTQPALEGIRAVLFDLYGTLFISAAGDIAASGDITTGGITADDNAASGKVSGPAVSAPELAAMKAYFSEAVASLHDGAKKAGNAWPEVRAESIWAAYSGPVPAGWGKGTGSIRGRELALRYELAFNPVYPMPKALETLEALASRRLMLGIISNAQFYTPLLFRAFFGAPPEGLGFDPALCIYSFEEKEAKPSPRLFAKARDVLARRGVTAGEILYIGNDMRNDIIPAAEAGFRAALFAGDRRSLRLREGNPDCAGKRPRMILTDLQSIIRGRYLK